MSQVAPSVAPSSDPSAGIPCCHAHQSLPLITAKPQKIIFGQGLIDACIVTHFGKPHKPAPVAQSQVSKHRKPAPKPCRCAHAGCTSEHKQGVFNSARAHGNRRVHTLDVEMTGRGAHASPCRELSTWTTLHAKTSMHILY